MNSESSLADLRAKALELENQASRVILGQESAIRLVVLGVLARGHVLLEGGVGVGKTTLLRTMARAIGGQYERVEGAIDLMPNDLVYYTYLDSHGKPAVSAGPLLKHGENLATFFFNEINRARPQVHALLLRVMAERNITAFDRHYALPHLQVFADRNQVEKEETFELPAAARDRFMLEVQIPQPRDPAVLDQLINETRFHNPDQLITGVSEGLLPYHALNSAASAIQETIHVSERLRGYVMELCLATQKPETYGINLADVDMGEMIESGTSPRGMSFLMRMSRVHAWLNDRNSVIPEDVQAVFAPTIAHRIFLKPVYEYRRAELIPELVNKLLHRIAAP